MNNKPGTPANPTALSTNLHEPICPYCEQPLAAAFAKGDLRQCGKCGAWFKILPLGEEDREMIMEVPPVTAMI